MNAPRVAVLAAAAAMAAAAEQTRCLTDEAAGGPVTNVAARYWAGRMAAAAAAIARTADSLGTREALGSWQDRVRAEYRTALGAMPERTPLNARVVRTVERDGYRAEHVLFERRPSHRVTASLFLPSADRFPPPWPGLLVPSQPRAAQGAELCPRLRCGCAERDRRPDLQQPARPGGADPAVGEGQQGRGMGRAGPQPTRRPGRTGRLEHRDVPLLARSDAGVGLRRGRGVDRRRARQGGRCGSRSHAGPAGGAGGGRRRSARFRRTARRAQVLRVRTPGRNRLSERSLTWTAAIGAAARHSFADVVHGALRNYDLSDLEAGLGVRCATAEQEDTTAS